MAPIKILFVQPVQTPYWTNRLETLAEDNTLDITLLLELDELIHRPDWTTKSIAGVNIEVLGSTSFEYNNYKSRSLPFKLTLKILKLRPDIIVLINATQILFSLPIKLFSRTKIALIVEDTPHATRNLGRLQRAIKNWAYRFCDGWFPLSDDAQTFLTDCGITKNIFPSSWSLDMQAFKQTINTKEHNRQTVIFVGQLIPRKGILQLLEAWSRLSKSTRASAYLTIVGTGPLVHEAQSFVKDNQLHEVSFTGQLNYQDVCTELQAADLFILPTLEDIYSLAVLEAMACGCPAIITHYCGARELITINSTGWIVDPMNIAEITSTLQYALGKDCDLTLRGKLARTRVKNMDNKIVMTKFAHQIKTLVAIS